MTTHHRVGRGGFVERNPWTPEEIELAAELYRRAVTNLYGDRRHTAGAEHRVDQIIAEQLHRTIASVELRRTMYGPSYENPRTTGVIPKIVPAQLGPPDCVLAERDRRRELEPSSITARLMGDPLPGRSALDRRRA